LLITLSLKTGYRLLNNQTGRPPDDILVIHQN
jgi:hypothetical protein